MANDCLMASVYLDEFSEQLHRLEAWLIWGCSPHVFGALVSLPDRVLSNYHLSSRPTVFEICFRR